MKHVPEGLVGDDTAERLELLLELEKVAHVVEAAAFRAAGVLETCSVARMILMAHELEEISDRLRRQIT